MNAGSQSNLQSGHSRFRSNQRSMHAAWKKCAQRADLLAGLKFAEAHRALLGLPVVGARRRSRVHSHRAGRGEGGSRGFLA